MAGGDVWTKQLDQIFYPQSVAIVGLPRGLKTGKVFLMALLDQSFSGAIYPVHPTAEEIDGLKAYPSISAIPDAVDLAIILVPHEHALPVIYECVEKGVKGAVLFTAGYKETGTEAGRHLEAELARVAKESGMRLFGPNCMGLYVPESGLSFFPGLSKKPGPVGFISHSGSLANILGRIAADKGIYFSKAVSLGNECDVTGTDILNYLAKDPKTAVIGGYLESIGDGPGFLNALKAASLKKPVILWKVGLNPEGQKAANSHTGAMASRRRIWQAVVSQSGAVPVKGFDWLTDALMSFSLLPDGLGDRIAILSGPGGMAVGAAEACGDEGLKLAELSADTRTKLSEFVPQTGTSLANPVDVGLGASFDIDIYIKAARALADDPGVDAVVSIGAGLSRELNETYTNSIIRVYRDTGCPFLMVNIPGFEKEFAAAFCQAGIPFYETAERALGSYAQVRKYQLWRYSRTFRHCHSEER
ncbi:MAG: CoA-binding protein [Desulfobacterales bacterium]|nr:CoA-binding protein [Desulfobacterales bacterium]